MTKVRMKLVFIFFTSSFGVIGEILFILQVQTVPTDCTYRLYCTVQYSTTTVLRAPSTVLLWRVASRGSLSVSHPSLPSSNAPPGLLWNPIIWSAH